MKRVLCLEGVVRLNFDLVVPRSSSPWYHRSSIIIQECLCCWLNFHVFHDIRRVAQHLWCNRSMQGRNHFVGTPYFFAAAVETPMFPFQKTSPHCCAGTSESVNNDKTFLAKCSGRVSRQLQWISLRSTNRLFSTCPNGAFFFKNDLEILKFAY